MFGNVAVAMAKMKAASEESTEGGGPGTGARAYAGVAFVGR